MEQKNNKSHFLLLARVITGSVLIFSGFVKGIDPLGSMYKFTDYFVAFNIEFLEPASLVMSVALSVFEMLAGIAIIAGIHMVISSWVVLGFMSFFTVLTLFIALTDPVADCGCFGDAIVVSNWGTFWKNLILMIPVVAIFIHRKKTPPLFKSPVAEWIALAFFLVVTTLIPLRSLRTLPVLDFRPFSTGTDIVEKMSIPPDAPADEYEITLYYQKNGEERAFRADSLPDSTWEWTRTESTLVSRGYQPEITNFYIESIEDGEDFTYDILYDPGYTFLMISHNLTKSSRKTIRQFNQIARWADQQGVNFLCLTASPSEEIKRFSEETAAEFSFFHSDEITLKTIIRSNPGLLLLKEGTILGKWHYRNIPHTDELKENLLSYSAEIQQKSKMRYTTGFYLSLLLIMLAMTRIIRPAVNKKFKQNDN